ncbi:hypothetical protein MO973_00135 [Paenibacillus sp. TRM 82003]|nr:hypothetical protein [Paenibacillus sp. TRM 82003]
MYYLVQVPLILVFVTGIVFSCAGLARKRKEAMLPLIAFVLLLFHALAMPIVNARLPAMFIERGMPVSEIARWLTVVAGISSTLLVIPWALLLVALFRRR